MLKHLRFTNFKTWAEADLPCGRITGLFGTNSSGKTSILQFLLLLKQTKEATDRALSLELNGSYVQLGTIKDAIHQHDETLGIDMDVTFIRDEPLLLANPSAEKGAAPLAQGHEFTMAASLMVQNRAPQTRQLSYKLGDHVFAISQSKSAVRSFDLSPRGEGSDFRFVRNTGRQWPLPGPVKGYAFPDQARTYFQNAGFLSDLEAAYEKAMDGIFYLGPLREYPKRDYLWARSRPTDVGQRGDKAIDAILAATEAKVELNLKPKTRRLPFQQMVAHWLKQLGLIQDFKVAEIKEGSNRWQAKVITRVGGSEVLLTDVGFGVSQVLPVVTLLLYVPEGSTVILEQPEIHLHPSAQAGLADVIIYAALHRRVQVILESHSEHLLLRLQRRIADEAISASDVKLYFCDASERVSTLTLLKVDLFGRVENWPENFMGDAFGETAQAELARLKRMKAAAE
jgi:predicted ATPase